MISQRSQRLMFTGVTLSITALFAACGGSSHALKPLNPGWEKGELVRWVRFNPCACLTSEAYVTSLEVSAVELPKVLKEQAVEPLTRRWERALLRRPLSAETRELLIKLKAQNGRPLSLSTELLSESVTLNARRFRLLELLSKAPVEDEPSQEPSREP